MKKTILLVCMALVTMFSANAQVPTTSSAGSDVWYFIKGMRGLTPTAVWVTAAADNSQVLEKELNYSSSQCWKVVVNGDGLALVNKAYGTYLNCDLDDYIDLTTIATPPTKTLQITASVLLENAVFVENKGAISQVVYVEPYPVENTFLMHAGGGGDHYGLVNYFDDYNDNASFLFIPLTAADLKPALTASIAAATLVMNTGKTAGNGGALMANLELSITNAQIVLDAAGSSTADYDTASAAIDNAMAKYLPIGNALANVNSIYSASSEGFSPGQFSPDTRTSFKEYIDGIQAVYDDPKSTTDDYNAAIADVSNVISLFKQQVILPQLSTSTKEIWYFIQGDRPVNTYMTSQGAGANLISAVVASSDEQLWKLVSNGTNGFALQNKASGEYLNPNLTNGGVVVSQATLPDISLKTTISTVTTNNSYRFWVENTTTDVSTALTFLLHAGNSNAILNYKNRTDHTTWLFLDIEALNRNLYLDAVKLARAAYKVGVVGTEFGQYTTIALSTFNDLITAAENKVLADLTHNELVATTTELTAATTAFKIPDLKPLVSATPTVSNKWFMIINNATAVYANGKAISSNGRLVDDKFTFETIRPASDSILFRFELNVEGTKVHSIINKANGLYMGIDGTMLAATVEGNDFDMTRLDSLSFLIKPTTATNPLHAAASSLVILNYAGVAGSASAWRIEFVKEETISAVETVNANYYHINTNNGIITVDGVDKFEVYSVVGQKQNIKSTLKSGVYFVRVNNLIQKVIVK